MAHGVYTVLQQVKMVKCMYYEVEGVRPRGRHRPKKTISQQTGCGKRPRPHD